MVLGRGLGLKLVDFVARRGWREAQFAATQFQRDVERITRTTVHETIGRITAHMAGPIFDDFLVVMERDIARCPSASVPPGYWVPRASRG
jgi:hypothetical protein